MSLIRKKSWNTAITLLSVIAAGVLLNLLGIQLNSLLGLPLYLDNVGTILSAVMGGYIPCITVGFLTNIINGFSSSYSIYYCVISVFIAVAAVSFADKLRRMRIRGILLAILTFAVLGGIMGGVLTWLIGGLDFGEGFAVDFAAKVNSVVPMGYFLSNILSNFLIDIVDKLAVTVISLIIFKLLPNKLVKYLSLKSWYYITVFEKPDKNNRKHTSLRIKVTLLVAVSTTLVASAAIGISILQFHNYTISEYITEGGYATELISDMIAPDMIDDYLTLGRSSVGYSGIEKKLQMIRDSSPDIKFIYVYQILEDGTHVVFDLDTADVPADKVGDVIEHNSTIVKYKDKFLAGEEIPVDICNDIYGWILSVMKPVKDADGNTACYVGVDLDMGKLRSLEFAFLAKIISLFIGFLIVIRTYAIWLAERQIINPINAIANVAARFKYDTHQARVHSVSMIDALNIQTGDEIENLYRSYKKTTDDMIGYFDEVQRRGEKIEKLQSGLIIVLADMVESRDKCTGDHVRKTAAYAEIILKQMQKEGIYADQITDEYISEVVSSAPLHDVGKIMVSDTILNKPGRLTDVEFKIMQGHTTSGGMIIDKAIAIVGEESDYLNEAKNLAEYHHEKWNGKGYPKGIAGEDIPLSARVMAVADVFDALVSRRSYKEPFTMEKAIEIIRTDAGTHFDPSVVKAFLDAEDEIRRVAKMNMEL